MKYMEYEIEQISRQIQSLEDKQSSNEGVSENRHREIMDYLLTIKMEGDNRHSSIKNLIYIILVMLVFLAFKIK